MMTVKEETDARMTTQLALRDSYNKRVYYAENYVSLITDELKGKKRTFKNNALIVNNILDQKHKGSILSKIIGNDERKSSKHKIYEWIYLYCDLKKPFIRREEHLIELHMTRMSTKKPANYIDYPLEIFITRHFLEKSALRLKVSTIEDMIKFTVNHIKLIFDFDLRKKCFDENGLVFVSQTEYIIFDSINERKVILKTVVPRNEWSNTKTDKLSLILDKLEHCQDFDKINDIAIIDISDFNGPAIINPLDVTFNYDNCR